MEALESARCSTIFAICSFVAISNIRAVAFAPTCKRCECRVDRLGDFAVSNEVIVPPRKDGVPKCKLRDVNRAFSRRRTLYILFLANPDLRSGVVHPKHAVLQHASGDEAE